MPVYASSLICFCNVPAMSTTYNFELSPRPNREGLHKISIRATADRKHTGRLDTGILIERKHWNQNAKHGQWVRRTHPSFRQLNDQLSSKLTEVRDAGLGIGLTFEKYANTYLEEVNKTRSVSQRKGVKSSLKKAFGFFKKGISLDEVNPDMAEKLKNHLLSTHISSSARVHLQRISRVFALAEKTGLIPKDPFRHIQKPSRLKSSKPRLSDSKIEKVENSNLKTPTELRRKYESYIEVSVDMFIFSYNAAGIRIGDLLEMRYLNFDDNRLTYEMAKNGKTRSIPINSKMRHIFEKYQRSDARPEDYIFPVLPQDNPVKFAITRSQKYSLKNGLETIRDRMLRKHKEYINSALAEAAGQIGIEKVTSHVARHSFADKARRMMKTDSRVTLDGLRLMLGHGDLATTQVYLNDLDLEGQDEAFIAIFQSTFFDDDWIEVEAEKYQNDVIAPLDVDDRTRQLILEGFKAGLSVGINRGKS